MRGQGTSYREEISLINSTVHCSPVIGPDSLLKRDNATYHKKTSEQVKRSTCHGKFQPIALGELLGIVWENSLTIDPLL